MKKISVAEPSIGKKEIEYVTRAVKSGWVSSRGEFIEEFETAFAAFCGVKRAVSTSNGTCALHLVLLALGIGPGDEVIVPTLSFVATANAVTYTGAKPAFADVDAACWCITAEEIEKRITPRTKAIMVVHLYGHPADMAAIGKVARKHKLLLIEDAAEAHGAVCRGKVVGGLSDAAVFSFYGNKILTTGEGGMVTTNSRKLADKIHFLKNHGMDPRRRYWHPEVGYNYRMTNLHAALGVAQLERVDEFLAQKRKIIGWYRNALDEKLVQLQVEMPWAVSAWWMVSVLVKGCAGEERRNAIIAALAKRGIETRPLFYPMHFFPMYSRSAPKGGLPVSEKLYKMGINLPSGVKLRKNDVAYVAECLHSILAYH